MKISELESPASARAEQFKAWSQRLHFNRRFLEVPPTPHSYEVRPRKDHRGFDLINDVPPFGRLWHAEPNAISSAVGYVKFRSRSHHAVIGVFDEVSNVIETHEHCGDFHAHLIE